jgi:hypothetical protein
MKVQELNNYGKGFADIITDPAIVKHMVKVIRQEFRNTLGLNRMLKMGWGMKREVNRMKKHDWSRLKNRGINQKFIDSVIQSTAGMKALADMLGMEKASDVYCMLWDRTGYDLMTPLFPSVKELNACEDSFASFKEYMKISNAANVDAGIQEVDILEDTSDVFLFNIKYCAWREVANEFGDPYLCYPLNCYLDEAWMPKYANEAGWKFERTGTLATGAQVCDFKFKRSPD